jgi:hypothetical protein
MGRQRYPNARELTVTADCGGSNGARVRLWKLELQKLADETGLRRAHNALSEIGLATTIVLIVGALGTMPPGEHTQSDPHIH